MTKQTTIIQYCRICVMALCLLTSSAFAAFVPINAIATPGGQEAFADTLGLSIEDQALLQDVDKVPFFQDNFVKGFIKNSTANFGQSPTQDLSDFLGDDGFTDPEEVIEAIHEVIDPGTRPSLEVISIGSLDRSAPFIQQNPAAEGTFIITRQFTTEVEVELNFFQGATLNTQRNRYEMTVTVKVLFDPSKAET